MYRFVVIVGICLMIGLLAGLIGGGVALMSHKKSPSSTNVVDQHEAVIRQLSDDVQSLRLLIEELIKKEEALRQDLGTPIQRTRSQRRELDRALRAFAAGYPSTMVDGAGGTNHYITDLANQVAYITKEVLTIEKDMRDHNRLYDRYVARFNETPSIWPVYGYIRSQYGWRHHPVKNARQFHNGIDIPGWMGAPVQATADGYVEFAGWGGGYGWIIVLSHTGGIQTLYAHLSEIGVAKGIRVNKGQLIGKIGNSGLSTGPHVHYEVRYRSKALEPSPYLSLDLFTAISKLW
jgi:murein DD-endopeptidase MepM/ murein hydrolase activator NlpD